MYEVQRTVPVDMTPILEKPVPYEGAAAGAIGVALMGGAVAAAIGLIVSFPFFRHRARSKASKPAAK